jgi:uncharacterized protein YbjT (DUF2867 family)
MSAAVFMGPTLPAATPPRIGELTDPVPDVRIQGMDVVVAGGHGKVGIRLLRLLAEKGHRARGLIRNPDHAGDLEDVGAEPVLCDIEALDDVSGCCEGADAVVFAAGAGPGSGPERKRTVDLGGALKLMRAGVRRYVMVSAISADRPEEWSEQMRPYYEAKAEADRKLVESGLDYTIVRPGALTDAAGTGRVAVGTDLERGEIPREDVAATLLAVLETPGTVGTTFELVSGDTPIDEAVRGL